MTETTTQNDTDITQPSVDEQLNNVLNTLTEHANEITRVLHDIRGSDYGTWSSDVNGNKWTIKHEDGDVEWLRQTTENDERYVISTRDTPNPDTVADALQDYPQFVDQFNDWVASINNTIDTAEDTLNNVETVESDEVVEQRDELADDALQVAHDLAETIQNVTNSDSGTFTANINDNEWVLKYHKNGKAKYLQIDGRYVLGYESPHPRYLNIVIEDFSEFVNRVNSWLDSQDENTAFDIDIERSNDTDTGGEDDGDD